MSWQNIPGRAAYLWVYEEWIKSNPRQGAIAVEVGVALGKSLAALCEMLDQANRPDIEVYAVDAWGGFAQNGEQQAEAKQAGGDFSLYAKYMMQNAPKAFERIRVLRTPSNVAWRVFAQPGGPSVDLVLASTTIRGKASSPAQERNGLPGGVRCRRRASSRDVRLAANWRRPRIRGAGSSCRRS